jgi:hypothetical protein
MLAADRRIDRTPDEPPRPAWDIGVGCIGAIGRRTASLRLSHPKARSRDFDPGRNTIGIRLCLQTLRGHRGVARHLPELMRRRLGPAAKCLPKRSDIAKAQ